MTNSTTNQFEYSPRQRQEILDAIGTRLAPEMAEEFLAKVTEFANSAISSKLRNPYLYSGQAEKELDRIERAINDLHPYVYGTFNLYLADRVEMSLDDILGMVAGVREELLHELQDKGRPKNPDAKLFITRCFFLWLKYTGKVPPRSPSKNSPFYHFVKAATPDEVYDTSSRTHVGDEMIGFVRRVLKHAHMRLEHRRRLGWQ
jgi:hypothetical protein